MQKWTWEEIEGNVPVSKVHRECKCIGNKASWEGAGCALEFSLSARSHFSYIWIQTVNPVHLLVIKC